ncbi:regucalcin-like isoform X1 [Sitodiplosis mosellana]|uniref:regucalcin-like isoform X1 n=2 Tax=Sitodiplosis mosellana TaxID=263140 RepID=UPI00244423B0|nr:regucalcin-like isoform X1 [Sitodiplosis mosellana]
MYFKFFFGCFIAACAFEVAVSMSFNVEVVPSPKTLVGTRTHWDADQQSLYYCDVYGNDSAILRYDFDENKVYAAGIDGELVTPFVIPVANSSNEFAVGLDRRVGIVQWDGKSPKATLDSIAFEVDSDKSNNRFNAAKADPAGRFYGGTMLSEKTGDVLQNAAGKVYKYIKGDNSPQVVLDNIYISNGMAWDQNNNKVYYIDSGKFDVKEYDYDPSTGNFSNEKLVIDYSNNGAHPGFLPDGLTIDTDGNLYITFYGGSKISKVDPKSGKVLMDIPFPVKQVTAVSFGGPNLDILYAITAADGDSSEFAGCLFKVTGLGAKGFAGDKVKL